MKLTAPYSHSLVFFYYRSIPDVEQFLPSIQQYTTTTLKKKKYNMDWFLVVIKFTKKSQ